MKKILFLLFLLFLFQNSCIDDVPIDEKFGFVELSSREISFSQHGGEKIITTGKDNWIINFARVTDDNGEELFKPKNENIIIDKWFVIIGNEKEKEIKIYVGKNISSKRSIDVSIRTDRKSVV